MDLQSIARWWVGKFNGDLPRAERAMMVVIGFEIFLLVWPLMVKHFQ
jgi:hypothetical protein